MVVLCVLVCGSADRKDLTVVLWTLTSQQAALRLAQHLVLHYSFSLNNELAFYVYLKTLWLVSLGHQWQLGQFFGLFFFPERYGWRTGVIVKFVKWSRDLIHTIEGLLEWQTKDVLPVLCCWHCGQFWSVLLQKLVSCDQLWRLFVVVLAVLGYSFFSIFY